jgi:hypothetical protein
MISAVIIEGFGRRRLFGVYGKLILGILGFRDAGVGGNICCQQPT